MEDLFAPGSSLGLEGHEPLVSKLGQLDHLAAAVEGVAGPDDYSKRLHQVDQPRHGRRGDPQGAGQLNLGKASTTRGGERGEHRHMARCAIRRSDFACDRRKKRGGLNDVGKPDFRGARHWMRPFRKSGRRMEARPRLY